MNKLLSRLNDFKYYQLHKFIKVRMKHRYNDALNDNTNWVSDWTWNDIKDHLFEEFNEFNMNEKLYNKKSDADAEAIKNELADIANLAFLLWAKLEYND